MVLGHPARVPHFGMMGSIDFELSNPAIRNFEGIA